LCRLSIDVPTGPDDDSAAAQTQPLPLDHAVARARSDLAEIRHRAFEQVSADAADMIAAHIVLLEDQALLTPVRQAIADGRDPVTAWTEQIQTLRATFERLDDEYLSARGQDVSSVGRRVKAYLSGRRLPEASHAHGVVMVDELDAPTAVALNSDTVVAVVTRRGGRSGHGVMVATSRGIPVLADAAGDFDHVADGAEVTLDIDLAAQSA
jgi:phosphocarrier protein FPr